MSEARLKCRGNFDNLPKWAREHIDVLEMRLGEMRDRFDGTAVEGGLVQISGGVGATGVDHHAVAQRNVYLEVLPGHRMQCRVEPGDDWTPPHVTIHGDYSFLVRPMASNALEIFPFDIHAGKIEKWPQRKKP